MRRKFWKNFNYTHVYTPQGNLRQVFTCRDPEVIVSGPAGTGKSRAVLEKLHAAALKYPGMRGLICRKTRKSLTQTGLVTFEKHVLEDTRIIKFHTLRQSYLYPNGSEIVVGGLDDPTKIMSSDYDLIYCQEARELTLDDWEALCSRLRNGVMPYQQILGDTNPDAPSHWIMKRALENRLTIIYSTHEDNPRLYNIHTNTWTDEGKRYVFDVLERLTGIRYKRLRLGQWVGSEGQVYDEFDPSVHVIHTLPPGSEHWPRFLSIDFGYTMPFVCQWWACDQDKRLYLYREIYHTKRLVEQHCKQILQYSTNERIIGIIRDHDAEDAATLDAHLVPFLPYVTKTTAAVKDISPGIQAVKTRLCKAGDGRPRLFFVRNALIERDHELSARALPTCTLEEIDAYTWRDLDATTKPEIPNDEHNHGMDAMRYMVAALDLVGPRVSRQLVFTR